MTEKKQICGCGCMGSKKEADKSSKEKKKTAPGKK